MEAIKEISRLLLKVKEQKPIIHHITNLVTINDCANIVLAIGGSPLMAFDESEVIDAVSIASSLVINIGTLNSNNYKGIIKAVNRANELDIPIVLDPVGVALSKYRSNLVDTLLKNYKISIIRGNMSEIKYLSGMNVKTQGIDSYIDMKHAPYIAMSLSNQINSIVAITGEVDVISNGKIVYLVKNGTKKLSRVTGTGCMTTSLIATFSGVTNNYLISTISGIMSMGISGEISEKSLKEGEGIGTFKVKLFDSIYNLNYEDFKKEGIIVEK